jgi:hypothetical protein
MAQNIFPLNTSDNWTLISSVTPTAGVATVSFTSISGYKKLLLRVVAPGQSVAADTRLTLNSDSGTNYTAMSGIGWGVSTGAVARPLVSLESAGYIALTAQTGSVDATTVRAAVIINEADTTGLKTINGWSYKDTGSTAVNFPNLQGVYYGSAAISTVTLTLSTGTYAATGTVALYGVKL